MRYNTPIYFVKNVNKHYDTELGDWIQGSTSKTLKRANVTDMSATRQSTIFGDVSSGRLVVRLQQAYTDSYDYIEINDKTYQVETKRVPSNSQSLVVIENG